MKHVLKRWVRRYRRWQWRVSIRPWWQYGQNVALLLLLVFTFAAVQWAVDIQAKP